MPSPNATPTPITPPRVPLIDPRTGYIDRAWYLFFLSLNNVATSVIDDSGLTFSSESIIASYEAALLSVNQELQTLPPAIDYSEDILKLRKENNLQPSSEVGELQDQINNVRQEFATVPQPSLGTLSAVNIDWVPYLGFDTAPSWIGTTAGQFWFDSATGSFNAKMGNNNITQQIGEEIFVYGKASAAITDSPLQIVYHTGVVGASGVIQFAPTVAGITDVNAIIGIATEDLALNGFGRATVFGVVRGITTNGTAFGEVWADDDVIWYNPVTGNPTKVEPVAPYIKVQVGLVIKAGAGGSGSFQVGIVRGSKLGGTDSNVQFGTLANSNLIQYSTSLGYWTNVTPASVLAAASGAPVTKTADFTVAATETWLINNKSGSTCTVTLPSAATYTGRYLTFKNMQAQLLVSASSDVVPIDSTSAGTAILLAVVGNWATMVSDGTNWIIMQQAANNCLLLE
jgi:hypothetical protein